MIALTSPYLWYTTRATGLVTLVLFTLVVSLGTLVANRVGGTAVGRFELNELHRTIASVAIVFLAIHIVTTVIDSYVATGPFAVIVPFISPYKRLPVALGTIALDLMVAVWVSSLLKARIANASWRFIHWFSWLAYAIALVHALTTGTDARHGIGLVIVLTCLATVAGAAAWRFVARPTRAAGRTALSPLGVDPEPRRVQRDPAPTRPTPDRGAEPPTRAAAFPRRPQPRRHR
ncbi:MAG: ferric reductase-like transmembrane domain-containing protein [Acidimicrobiales bacterium]